MSASAPPARAASAPFTTGCSRSAGRPEAILAQAAADAGVTREGETREGHAELASNFELFRALNVTGTPTFVIGDQVLRGRGRL